MPVWFGAHMSIAGGMEQAVERACRAGCDALQVFVKSSNQWKARPFRPGETEAFRGAAREAGLRALVAHNSYLVNMASPEAALRRRSVQAMRIELGRCIELGVPDLVIHPGSHMGDGETRGIRRLAGCLDRLRETAGDEVRVLLESTAGQGNHLGWRFEHLRDILASVRDDSWLGVCIDTCHVFAAGFDLRTAKGYRGMVEDLQSCVGIDRVGAVHVNDSKTPCGSRVDRHAHIGEGEIGLEGFRRMVRDRHWSGRPFILETPKGPDLGEDRRNLRRLRGMVRRRPA